MSQTEAVEVTTKPTLTSSELNFAQYNLERSFYSYLALSQQSGGNTVTITAGGGNQSIIDINPGFYNLSKSYLEFYTSIATLGANNMIQQNIVGMPAIREIQLKGKSTGTIINQIRYVNKYVESTIRRNMSKDEAMSLDTPSSAGAAPVIADGCCEGLTYTYVAANTALARPTGAANTRELMTVGGNVEPAYLLGTAADTPQFLKWRLPLGLLKDSFFDNGKTLYFPEGVTLMIVWDTRNSSYYLGTSATVPTTGAANATVDVVLNDFTLQMCVEENLLIQDKLRREVDGSGMKIPLDTVESNVTNITGTSHSLQSRYSNVFGARLKKFWWAPFNNADTGTNLFYDHSNLAAAKVTSFYVNLDNKRLNKDNYTEANGDSFMEARDKLKGTNISSMDQYYYNFAYLIDFANNYNKLTQPTNPPEQNFIDGLDLSTEKRIDVVMTAAGALNHYTFAVIQKTLMITKQGFYVQ